jgi:EAL domain-containing protein (putative c-di-GMP-specific phosphodiesterase class I)/GGDEF domain-containing protein
VSLFKQIQILVTLLLLIMLIIVLRTNFNSAKEFTTNQSFLNAKNVANVLALSLSSNPKDDAFVKTSINAMYDGGYYEEITLTRPDGTVIYQKSEDLAVYGVPDLFLKTLDLHIPVAEALIMDGWSVYAKLQVKEHPGTSYRKLWVIFKQLCLQFLLLGGVAIFISYMGLRHLLKALNKIKTQAEALSNNEFIITQEIPKTPELKKVVLAMNSMVEKVQIIFNRHLENLTQFQELRYTDRVTGLHNRFCFIKQLSQIIKNKGKQSHGQVIILGLAGMESTGISQDRPLTHRLFKNLSEILQEETDTIENALAARFPRQEFGVILPNSSPEDAMATAKAVIDRFLLKSSHDKKLKASIEIYGGLTAYSADDELSTVLSKADYALSVAKIGLPGTIEMFDEKQSHAVLGKSEWKSLIENAFSENRFHLTAQPVISSTGEFHREVFVSMTDQKNVQHHAKFFIPMVMTLGLSSRLDQYVLIQSANYLSAHRDSILTINLTTDFCRDRSSTIWFRRFLQNRKPIKNRLVFEIHEATLIQYPDICIDFAELIKGLGFKLGIDQFTIQRESLNLLKQIKPYYIKIERDYLEVFDDPEKVDLVLNNLFTVADSLGIRLVATKVENESQRKALASRKITYFQGNGIAESEPLED